MSSTAKSEDGSPSCWICLCDEPDDDGKLPVRDCSCRGDTGAGYAHLSCLVQYAQTKSEKCMIANADNINQYFEAWKKCPNCEQMYQHQLSLDLASSLILFMEDKYPECNTPKDYLLMVQALQVKMVAIKNAALQITSNALRANVKTTPRGLIEEGIETANRVIELYEVMKTNLPHAWILVRDNQAFIHGQLATFHMLNGNDEKAIYYCQMGLDLYKATGNTEGIESTQLQINYLKKGNSTSVQGGQSETIVSMRQFHNRQVKESGMDSTEAIRNATTLAGALSAALDGQIEAERILTKYLPISRRVHGEKHSQTKEIEDLLHICQRRFVVLENGEEFKALRYEDGGDKCVVQGPVKSHYYEGHNECTEYTVDSSSLLITNGTPIVCQGLQKGAHLNGKLADIRSYDNEKERYTIYFEDTKLKPVAVKRKNVRIVFDLLEIE